MTGMHVRKAMYVPPEHVPPAVRSFAMMEMNVRMMPATLLAGVLPLPFLTVQPAMMVMQLPPMMPVSMAFVQATAS